jgi:formate hydrogenlyase transcriptional activator
MFGVVKYQDNAFTSDNIEFLTQIANQVAIAVENALAFGEIRELKEKLAQERLHLEDEIRSEMNFAQIIGKSPSLRRALKQVETVAPTDSTVLIYGDTGTGKELIARAIHDLSPRQYKPFVKLNCAAIPTGLLESELFGHEKGAFTGAIAQRIGRFQWRHDFSRRNRRDSSRIADQTASRVARAGVRTAGKLAHASDGCTFDCRDEP